MHRLFATHYQCKRLPDLCKVQHFSADGVNNRFLCTARQVNDLDWLYQPDFLRLRLTGSHECVASGETREPGQVNCFSSLGEPRTTNIRKSLTGNGKGLRKKVLFVTENRKPSEFGQWSLRSLTKCLVVRCRVPLRREKDMHQRGNRHIVSQQTIETRANIHHFINCKTRGRINREVVTLKDIPDSLSARCK